MPRRRSEAPTHLELAHAGFTDRARRTLEAAVGYPPTVGERVYRAVTSHPTTVYLGAILAVTVAVLGVFLGDAAAWGNAELRLRLGSVFVLLPGDVGVFGLGDVGRVFLEGESSTVWHGAVGGGLWMSVVRPDNVFTIAAVSSAERTGVYFRAGFAY